MRFLRKGDRVGLKGSDAPSMYDALWAIANMQVQEETDKGEVLALCMSIARIELEKCSTAGK